MIRLDKMLCDCGFGTRTEVKKALRQGKATVNGEVVRDGAFKVDEGTDQVCFGGQVVSYEKYSYFLFHKPAGCVTAAHDNRYETVMDYFSDFPQKDLAPVGRLDLDTEGLLLITNDGALAHHLLSPAHHVPKTYYAVLDQEVPSQAIAIFKEGLDIGDEKNTLPAELTILPDRTALLTITEGRFHQVKRMFEKVGCQVTYLKRLSMGPLELGDLPVGEYRRLTEDELDKLKS